MNKKNDDLLRLAFGELNADAAHAVEAKASGDPSARAELEAFRELRSALQHLPTPPPDGLSAERLRAAILDRELRAKRSPAFSWNLAPFALAAVAAVAFFTRQAPQMEPQIVADARFENQPEAKPFEPLRNYTEVARKSVVPPPVEMEKPAESLTAVVRRRSGPPRRQPVVVKNENSVVPPPVEANPVAVAYVPPREPETISAPPSTIFAGPGTRTTMNSDDTVVLISSKRDLDTGAPAATETEATNVLVGG